MKTITATQLEQVSGGYNQCLLSIFDAVSNSSQCIVRVGGEMPVFNIPMEYALPLMLIAVGAQLAYDFRNGTKSVDVHLPVVTHPVTFPEFNLNVASN